MAKLTNDRIKAFFIEENHSHLLGQKIGPNNEVTVRRGSTVFVISLVLTNAQGVLAVISLAKSQGATSPLQGAAG